MIAITAEPIDLVAAAARCEDPAAGAVVSFVGTVRNHSHGRDVLYLDYEAYPEMAITQLAEIAAVMQGRWPILQLALIHRVGRLAIGEAAVYVGVATAHRADAFEAARFAIDAIKFDLPIWKRETCVDGTVWVDSCCTSGVHDQVLA